MRLGLFSHTSILQMQKRLMHVYVWYEQNRSTGPHHFPRFVEIFCRGAPAFGISTRFRCRPGDGSAPTAMIPAALAATVAITQQSKR